jgi:HD-GYP domain-containing protein (c-di-GMP phosphodiesterase class II)
MPGLQSSGSVCDAYNAMTSDQPYDRSRPHDQAIEEIRACAGSQFDPVVVEAFCRTIEAPGPDLELRRSEPLSSSA